MPSSDEDQQQPVTLAQKVLGFLDQVEAELEEGRIGEWTLVAERLIQICEAQGERESRSSLQAIKAEADQQIDPALASLDTAYEQLQSNLIELREAVATSMTSQNMLGQILEKNREYAKKWSERAEFAKQQNPDLAEQAFSRMKTYESAAVELEDQYRSQTETTNALRERLIVVETMVSKAKTRKIALHARSSAASAFLSAQRALSDNSVTKIASELENVEKSVAENELQISKLELPSPAPVELSTETIDQAIASLLQTLKAFELLAKKVTPKTASQPE